MSNKDRKRLFQLHNEGYSYRQLALIFGCNKNTVAEIIRKEKKYEERHGHHGNSPKALQQGK